jgi:hypothetical protein
VNGTIRGSATVRVTAAADLLAPAGSRPGGAGADALDAFFAYHPGFLGGVFSGGAAAWRGPGGEHPDTGFLLSQTGF